MIDNDILVINNAFSKTLFKFARDWILSPNFFWSYSDTTGVSPKYLNADDKPDTFSFSRILLLAGNRFLPESHLVEAGFLTMLDNNNISFSELYRIRIGLLTKTLNNDINTPHVDHVEEHFTALLYLNTTNAPTYFYDTFYDTKSNKSSFDFKRDKKLSVFKQVPCVENSAVIFNGLRYHSSSTPTDKSRRVVVNFNFKL